MGSDALITIVTFFVVYGLIAFEWLNKAVAALLGVMVLLILGVIDAHLAASFIDFETIMLLIGMMGIVAVLKKTGFFAIITVRIARLTGGQPLRILILFCAATAIISAFLDNVTTVLIMVPIIIELTRGMGLDPKIYVVALAMASNLGGTATLVGDPPNIIIGSQVGLTFNQFAGYLFLPLEVDKKAAIDLLTRKLASFQTDTARVTAHCMDCIAPGDLIIAHSPTAYIRDALVRTYTELQRTYKVLVLKQDFIRAKALVNDLEHHQVDHILIPESNLSHYLKTANKLFIGAVSVTSDNQVVTGIGTANVVSLCNWYHVPVYLFVESIKFAHHTLQDQHIYTEDRDQTDADFTFHMKTFSHDFFDLAMVNHVITETGEIERPVN